MGIHFLRGPPKSSAGEAQAANPTSAGAMAVPDLEVPTGEGGKEGRTACWGNPSRRRGDRACNPAPRTVLHRPL